MVPEPRTYWIEQMEAAHGFMQQVLATPVQECGELLSCLREAARSAGVRIVFREGKHLGIFERLFHLRRSLIEPVLRVAEGLLKRGCVLRIEDAYRALEVQAHAARSAYVVRTVLEKVRWELDGAAPTPELVFRRLGVWSATTPIFANHTSGSAVDVSLLAQDGTPVDLGAPYPELSHRTPMSSPFVSRQARRNRRMLCQLFAEQDFAPYPYEFWHFSHGDADYEVIAGRGRAARFGPVHLCPQDGQVRPVADIRKSFLTVEDVAAFLQDPGRS